MEDEAYAILHTHSWQAGMMVANREDIVCGAYKGVKLECSRCEDIHPSSRPCPYAGEATLELWGFDPATVNAALVCAVCGGDSIECRSCDAFYVAGKGWKH